MPQFNTVRDYVRWEKTLPLGSWASEVGFPGGVKRGHILMLTWDATGVVVRIAFHSWIIYKVVLAQGGFILEMTRDFRPDAVGAADKFLVSASALSLTEMRRRVWRVIPKVLGRGRIGNIDEFYLVKNVLDDDGEDLSEEEGPGRRQREKRRASRRQRLN